jgi:uncharacterized membrane protein YsdA (DUF1294 family)
MKKWSDVCGVIAQVLGAALLCGWLWVVLSAHPWWVISRAVLPLYAVATALTLLAYHLDKRAAAQADAWRTPERTLHKLNFAGGLIGGALGQWWLRHKSQKQSFLKFYYAAVAAHVALWSAALWLR